MRTSFGFTKQLTFRQTKSQPRNLLSIATLNSARSRKFFTNSKRARIAQTCFGKSGRFCPIRRPLFQALCFGIVVGSWILGMIFPPCHPPDPDISIVQTVKPSTFPNVRLQSCGAISIANTPPDSFFCERTQHKIRIHRMGSKRTSDAAQHRRFGRCQRRHERPDAAMS